jgi:hypothetical protein
MMDGPYHPGKKDEVSLLFSAESKYQIRAFQPMYEPVVKLDRGTAVPSFRE